MCVMLMGEAQGRHVIIAGRSFMVLFTNLRENKLKDIRVKAGSVKDS